MALAQGIKKVVAYKKEAAWGVAPGATGGKELSRITGVGQLAKATFQSQEIAKHQQISGFRHGLRTGSYSLNGELSAGKYLDFWEAVTRAAYSAAPTSGALITVTASATAPHFTRSSGSWITSGFRVGDVVRWAGWLSPATANNNKNFLITALTATDMTVAALDGSPVVARAAGDSVTATMQGKRTSVPASGHTDDSFYFEDWYSDIAQSEQFSGCKFQDLSVQLSPGGNATITLNFMGKDMVPGTSQYFTTPAEPTQSDKLAGVSGVVILDGAPTAIATGMNFTVNAGLTQAEVIGSTVSPAIFQGLVTASGQITTYFEDSAMRDAFLEEQLVSLIGAFTASDAPDAEFVVFNFSNVKLGGANKDDGATGIVQTLPFTPYKANQGVASLLDATISIQDSLAT